MATNSGPNPIKLVADHVPAHLADLRDERNKAVARVRELNEQITIAETYLAVAPPEAKEKP